MTNLPAFLCSWEHHGRGGFQDHTVKELFEHLFEDNRTIIEKENQIMTDLSGIQQDEQDLGAAQAQEASDVTAALQGLEAEVAALQVGTPITQAQIDALRTPLQAAIASAQGTDAAAKAATPPPPAPAP